MSEKNIPTLNVTLVKSPIGYNKRQKATVQALGLRKLGQTVQRPDSNVIRGMINKVAHLVQVEKVEG